MSNPAQGDSGPSSLEESRKEIKGGQHNGLNSAASHFWSRHKRHKQHTRRNSGHRKLRKRHNMHTFSRQNVHRNRINGTIGTIDTYLSTNGIHLGTNNTNDTNNTNTDTNGTNDTNSTKPQTAQSTQTARKSALHAYHNISIIICTAGTQPVNLNLSHCPLSSVSCFVQTLEGAGNFLLLESSTVFVSNLLRLCRGLCNERKRAQNRFSRPKQAQRRTLAHITIKNS